MRQIQKMLCREIKKIINQNIYRIFPFCLYSIIELVAIKNCNIYCKTEEAKNQNESMKVRNEPFLVLLVGRSV